VRVRPRTRRSRRLIGAAVVVLTLALVVWFTARRGGDDETTALEYSGFPVTSYAHDGEPWFPAYIAELQRSVHRPDLVLGARNVDVAGRYVNVRESRRVSDEPDAPVLTVWFFGGSTMFGVGQRDEHTIPSEVARLAAAAGIPIRAVNFGISADVNWTETLRFAEELRSSLPKPDLVVFYDGANDMSLGWQRAADGPSDPSESIRMPVSDADRADFEAARGVVADEEAAGGSAAELTARQYARGVDLARDLGRSYGIDVVHFWQPTPQSKDLTAGDDGLLERLDLSREDHDAQRRTYAEAREASGADPIDLSAALDDVGVPVFFDFSHTNELGAATVAAAMYEHLAPRLRSHLTG